MKDNDAVTEYIRRLASAGGKARSKKLSPKRRKDIARKAANTRWNKNTKGESK
jgi:hypothetical protein